MKSICLIFAISGIFLAQASVAGPTSSVLDGPCQASTKNYHDKDGASPTSCEMIKPSYEFKIFANGAAIWEGYLPADKDWLPYPETELAKLADDANKAYSPARAGVFVGRCERLEPEFSRFSFGESRLVGGNTASDGRSTIHFPVTEGASVCIRVPNNKETESSVDIRRASGSIISYRVIVKVVRNGE